MSKKITDIAGNEIKVALPKIRDVNPVGTCLLVELITPEEIMGPTKLHMPEGAKTTVSGAPQGYIKKIGPKVSEDWGFKIGDRVVLQGSFVPLPEASCLNGRALCTVEPHTIKAILVE